MTCENAHEATFGTSIEQNIPNNLFNAKHYYDKKFSIVNNIEEETIEDLEETSTKTIETTAVVTNFSDPIDNYGVSNGADDLNEDSTEPVKNFEKNINEKELDEVFKRKMFYDEVQNKSNFGIISNIGNEHYEESTAITNMNNDETSILTNIDNETYESTLNQITNTTEEEVSKVMENLNINNNRNSKSSTKTNGTHKKPSKNINLNNYRTNKKELSESDIKRLEFQIHLFVEYSIKALQFRQNADVSSVVGKTDGELCA